MKRCLVCLLLTLLAAISAFAADQPAQAPPAVGKFQGAYNLTFNDDPNLNDAFTYCAVFTNTGGIPGFPNSGTFSSPSNPTWTGTWFVLGDGVVINTVFNPTETVTMVARRQAINRIGGRWADTVPATGVTDSAGVFYGSFLSQGCPGVAATSGNPFHHRPTSASQQRVAPPVVGKFQGSYNLTFVDDPNFDQSATYCIVFKNTGSILGFTNSGTFSTTNVPGWTGTWFVLGDEVIITTAFDSTHIIPMMSIRQAINRIGGRWSFVDTTNGDTGSAGEFFGTFLSTGCPAAAAATNDSGPFHTH